MSIVFGYLASQLVNDLPEPVLMVGGAVWHVLVEKFHRELVKRGCDDDRKREEKLKSKVFAVHVVAYAWKKNCPAALEGSGTAGRSMEFC